MRWINPVLVSMLVAGLVGCGGAEAPAVCEEPAAWTVRGESVPAGVGVALAAARAASPCALPEFGGTVTFQPLPLSQPDGALLDGLVLEVACNPQVWVTTWWEPAVERTPLVHELGHVLWERCGRSSFDAARGCHPRAFLRWAWAVDGQVAAALGHAPLGSLEVPAYACPEGGQVP